MVCQRNQFGYRLFFLPLPADIFASVFHSLNSIKKSACCYFKLRHISFFLRDSYFKPGQRTRSFLCVLVGSTWTHDAWTWGLLGFEHEIISNSFSDLTRFLNAVNTSIGLCVAGKKIIRNTHRLQSKRNTFKTFPFIDHH